jgi:hypothetical protein
VELRMRTSFPLTDLAKTLGVIAILEALVFGIISLAFGTPLKGLWEPYLLFFAPALVALPLILHARRFFDRPKLCAFWLALGLSAYSTLIALASLHSGLLDWMVPGTTTLGNLGFTIVVGAAAVSVSAYFFVRKLRASRNSRA